MVNLCGVSWEPLSLRVWPEEKIPIPFKTAVYMQSKHFALKRGLTFLRNSSVILTPSVTMPRVGHPDGSEGWGVIKNRICKYSS